MFEKCYGNEAIKKYLQNALQQNSLPQTLLFEGMEGIGKSLFAKELASLLLETKEIKNHPDFHEIRPEGKSAWHAIDDLRKFMAKVYEAPFSAARKVFLIYDADRMQTASANALLKTLEEPSSDTTILLITNHAKDLLPTILSRCVQLSFHPLDLQDIVKILTELQLPTQGAALAHGSAGRAVLLAQDTGFLALQEDLLDLLSKPPFYPELVERLEVIEKKLESLREEDPVGYCRQVELLFNTFLLFARDQTMKEVGGGVPFFPHIACQKQEVSLVAMEKRVGEMVQAFQRNVKLSTCLQRGFVL